MVPGYDSFCESASAAFVCSSVPVLPGSFPRERKGFNGVVCYAKQGLTVHARDGFGIAFSHRN